MRWRFLDEQRFVITGPAGDLMLVMDGPISRCVVFFAAGTLSQALRPLIKGR